MSTSNWKQVSVIKAHKWRCVKCDTKNHSVVKSCKNCGHEPTLGRRDQNPEGRKYTPTEE